MINSAIPETHNLSSFLTKWAFGSEGLMSGNKCGTCRLCRFKTTVFRAPRRSCLFRPGFSRSCEPGSLRSFLDSCLPAALDSLRGEESCLSPLLLLLLESCSLSTELITTGSLSPNADWNALWMIWWFWTSSELRCWRFLARSFLFWSLWSKV